MTVLVSFIRRWAVKVEGFEGGAAGGGDLVVFAFFYEEERSGFERDFLAFYKSRAAAGQHEQPLIAFGMPVVGTSFRISRANDHLGDLRAGRPS